MTSRVINVHCILLTLHRVVLVMLPGKGWFMEQQIETAGLVSVRDFNFDY